MKEYISNLNKDNLLKAVQPLKEIAIEQEIPIISDEALLFITQVIRILQPKYILEIGTAIGYSAINMALTCPNTLIDTIERVDEYANLARKNIENFSLQERINCITADGLELDHKLIRSQYDLIFIDAAKGQYINFFKKYSPLLSQRGLVITDNILFHGLVTGNEEIHNRNLRQLVRKIDDYNHFLATNKDFITVFYNIGDGIAISEKVKR